MTEPEHINSANYAYGLIGAYAIVYLGIAVCSLSWLHGNPTDCSPFIDLICCLRAQDLPCYYYGPRKFSHTNLQQNSADEHYGYLRYCCHYVDEY